MPVETRVAAAEAFWRDEESQDIGVQHVEVIVTLARRLKFRTKSVQALPSRSVRVTWRSSRTSPIRSPRAPSSRITSRPSGR